MIGTVFSNNKNAANLSPSISLSFLKRQPRSYRTWQKPVSEQQINDRFEQQILPELLALLELAFRELGDLDREEAVQDATCQALEAYRALRLYQTDHEISPLDQTALVLAKFASSQYLVGIRFAARRSIPHL